jgi:hypothetical protein
MIRLGLAEPVIEDDGGYDTATAEPMSECAVLPTARKRQRGRPLGSKNKAKE